MSQSLLPTPALGRRSCAGANLGQRFQPSVPSIAKPTKEVKDYLLQGLHALASLRLTVVLFALSLVLVFYGTWGRSITASGP